MESSETFGIGFEMQDLGSQDQILVSVLTEFQKNQDQSWHWSRFKILFQDMSWSWSRLKIIFKKSLGIGLERQKYQDKINTKQNNHKESKKWTPGWLVVEIMMLTFKHKF